jgi:CHAD domain-containing protein
MICLLEEGADVESASAWLADKLDVRPGRARAFTATYYDTFDGRLHAAGVTLRHSDGRLLLSDRATGAELVGAEAPAAKRLFEHDLPEPLRARLADAVEMRALLPVAKVKGRRLPVAVLNADEKTVVRIVVESYAGLHGRLYATAVRGYDRDLERVAAALALPEAGVPVVDEAISAAGGSPAGTSSKLSLLLDPDAPATRAAEVVFNRLLEVIHANLPGTLDDVDTEFLHDFRVAVRRTRSLQRQFKRVYPERLRHFRDEFKRLQQVTGELRDLDVYLLDFEGLRATLPEPIQADLDPLKALVERRRAAALTATRRALRSRRTQDALDEWAAFVADAPASGETVLALASERIGKVYRRMVKLGSAIDDSSPAEDLHELRKVGKELRYLLEFFSSLYPPDVVKPFVKTLKGLQDQLGRFQDREVQANALRAWAPEVQDPPALMAMGVLVERFRQEEAAAREQFAERFAAFASKQQRALIKDQFG